MPLSTFRTTRRIEFADTDMGGIVHFSRFFVFMETAEHELLRSIGTSVHHQRDGVDVGWPRVDASCDYQRPARYGDEIEIDVRIARKGTTSMTYEFAFRRGEVLLARGRMTSVFCRLGGSQPEKMPIPAEIAEHFEEAV